MSGEAFGMYPCLLEYRSTRAPILAGTDRGDAALELLVQELYEGATPKQRAEREVARAYVLRRPQRTAEADDAAATAVELDPPTLGLLRSLGYSPNPAT
ncbi:MAG TPA: hypothetical protein VGM97_16360 [Steroidobacteraceae bacterium]